MTISSAEATSRTPDRKRFRRAIYVYDLDALTVDWHIEGDTLYQQYPGTAPPGYLQDHTRVLVPLDVQESLREDFPALRRLAEIAEAAHPAAPIDHPSFCRMQRHIRILYAVCIIKTVLVVTLAALMLV